MPQRADGSQRAAPLPDYVLGLPRAAQQARLVELGRLARVVVVRLRLDLRLLTQQRRPSQPKFL
eukprot:960864-Pleurochrysis_carterae.AAC.1